MTLSTSRRRTARLHRHSRRGAMTFLIAIMLIVLFAMTAFSVDVAYMQLVRTELRTSTDLAARAGAESLARTKSATSAIVAAKNAATLNKVAGEPLQLRDSEIVFGKATKNAQGVPVFVAGSTPYNSVRVQGSRGAGSLGGSVGLFFGRVLDVNTFDPTLTATVTTNGTYIRDICLVVDRSGSMDEYDPVSGTKWQGLLDAAQFLYPGLQQTAEDSEQLGLVSYSSDSSINRTLTTDYTTVDQALKRLSPNGWTNITSGMLKGMVVLEAARPEAQKVMLLMTDGLHNTGPAPQSLLSEVRNANIIIHTITFGADADKGSMKNIASQTGGYHYHAPTAAELQAIFEQIGLGNDGLGFVD